MQILVATWSVRFAMIAALAVGGLSFMAGCTGIEAFDRAVGAAIVFILIGKFLIGRLMTPEQRLMLMRAQRASGKGGKKAKSEKKEKGKKGKKDESDDYDDELQASGAAVARRRAA